jgi:hypothetical protein
MGVKIQLPVLLWGLLPKHISTKKMPNSTKVTPKKGHHNLVSKSDFCFFWVFAPRALENRSAAYTYSHSNDEIKNVIGKTTVTAAIASEPIHCPQIWYLLVY